MSDTDPKNLVPAQTELQPSLDKKPSAIKFVPDGKGGIIVSPNEDATKKPEEKKKAPRGSSAFRHA